MCFCLFCAWLLGPWTGSPARAESAAELAARLEDPAAVKQLAAQGRSAVPALLEALEGAEHRDVILHLLGQLGDPAALEAVLRHTGDPVIEHRLAAIYALRRFSGEAALAAAVRGLGDPEPRVQLAALHALEAQQARPEAPAVARLLEADDWPVRKEAARVLGRLRAEESLPALVERLQVRLVTPPQPKGQEPAPAPKPVPEYAEEIPAVRLECLRALGRIGSAGAVAGCLPLFAYGTDGEKQAAVEAVAQMGPAAIDPVLQRLAEVPEQLGPAGPDTAQACYLTVCLARLGEPRAVPFAVRCLPASDPFGAIELIQFLGAQRAAEAAPALVRLLKETRVQQVQDALCAALPRLGEPASRALLEVLPERGLCVEVMKLLARPELNWAPALPKILEYLEDEDHEIRLAALRALVGHQARDAVPAIKTALVYDPDERVREVAAEALQTLTGENLRK